MSAEHSHDSRVGGHQNLGDLLRGDLLTAATKKAGLLIEIASAETRLAALSVLGMFLLLTLCAASIVIGWGLVIASLLYIVSEYSTTTWLLTALGIAAAHGVLALCCWHYAAALARNVTMPATRRELTGDSETKASEEHEVSDQRFAA